MVQRKVGTVALIFVVSSFLMFAVGMVLVSQADGCEPTAVITNTLPPLHTSVSPSIVDSSAIEVEETQIIATPSATVMRAISNSAAELEETQIIATILAATPIPQRSPQYLPIRVKIYKMLLAA
jgi:hypothetical protein